MRLNRGEMSSILGSAVDGHDGDRTIAGGL